MMRHLFQSLALILFCIYLAVFPGSTMVVALDRVPSWGIWMGGALLLLQGAAALCWLLGRYGARGGLAALLVFVMAWAVEYAGVTTGVPFGSYYYTGALQPQLFGIVPLAIPCAWLMVATGAWQIATTDERRPIRHGSGQATKDERRRQSFVVRRSSLVVAATLVLLLDLQIETVATKINQYWIWWDSGLYYGVPTANFVAWWLVGLALALMVETILSRSGERAPASHIAPLLAPGSWLLTSGLERLPTYLYLLSTLMFAIINLARGYTVAGLVGVLVLLVVAPAFRPTGARSAPPPRRAGIADDIG